MTRKEAICIVEEIRDDIYNYGTAHDNLSFADEDKIESLNMAIAMFKAEPCEDCISKEKVYEIASYIQDYLVSMYNPNDISEAEILNEINHYINALYDLPSVQPIRPKGHWIPLGNYDDYGDETSCGSP